MIHPCFSGVVFAARHPAPTSERAEKGNPEGRKQGTAVDYGDSQPHALFAFLFRAAGVGNHCHQVFVEIAKLPTRNPKGQQEERGQPRGENKDYPLASFCPP